MNDAVKERVASDLKEVQSKGGERIRRIRDIVKDAATQTAAEIKEGSGEIGSIAKGTFTGIVDNLNQPSNPDLAAPDQTEPDATEATPEQTTVRWQTLMLALFKVMKQRWNQAVLWYNDAKVQAQAAETEPTLVEQKQSIVEDRVGEMGVAIAKKELQVRHQLKVLLETVATKL